MLDFKLFECEKGKIWSNQPQIDMTVFDLSVVNCGEGGGGILR